MEASTYQEVKNIREQHIKDFSHDHFKLNQFHDTIMVQVIKLAILHIKEQYGPIPSPFSFFVMGSAGRFEQSIWSDQDHGIIYEETNPPVGDYFLKLGKEISDGLYEAGYEYCHGGVMAGNPAWCKSQQHWEQQITAWVDDSSWESIRNLLIFVDSRSIYGESEYLTQIKHFLIESIKRKKQLHRILDNTRFYQKGIGILGQFLVETHGLHSGALNLKEKAFFPFVNAIRFLALKENIIETSTLTRIDKLSEEVLPMKEKTRTQFLNLLNYRLLYGDHSNYDTGHFLSIDKLTKEEKKEVKEIMKTAILLSHYVSGIAQKKEG